MYRLVLKDFHVIKLWAHFNHHLSTSIACFHVFYVRLLAHNS